MLTKLMKGLGRMERKRRTWKRKKLQSIRKRVSTRKKASTKRKASTLRKRNQSRLAINRILLVKPAWSIQRCSVADLSSEVEAKMAVGNPGLSIRRSLLLSTRSGRRQLTASGRKQLTANGRRLCEVEETEMEK